MPHDVVEGTKMVFGLSNNDRISNNDHIGTKYENQTSTRELQSLPIPISKHQHITTSRDGVEGGCQFYGFV